MLNINSKIDWFNSKDWEKVRELSQTLHVQLNKKYEIFCEVPHRTYTVGFVIPIRELEYPTPAKNKVIAKVYECIGFQDNKFEIARWDRYVFVEGVAIGSFVETSTIITPTIINLYQLLYTKM